MKVPILRLRDILLTSIQVEMSDEDAVAFQTDLLRTLAKTEAKGIVIDITGLSVVDSFLARVVKETATMAQMLGAEVVLTGMRPEVAIVLTEMGRELLGVETALNLEQGFYKIQLLIEGRAR